MNHGISNRESLVHRVNELYHDLQSREFDVVHSYRHAVECVFWQREVVPRIVSSGGTNGIDLCTGTGFVPGILLQALPKDRHIRCFDISAGALQEAQRRLATYADRTSFDTADAAALPVEDGLASWVSMNAALHHMPDPPAVLREIDRVLKPGGIFCLGYEPNAKFFASRRLVRLERLIWHAFWYGSPARNVQRIRRLFRRTAMPQASHDVDHLDAVNASLLAEGLITTPLTLHELRSMVDVHTTPMTTIHIDAASTRMP